MFHNGFFPILHFVCFCHLPWASNEHYRTTSIYCYFKLEIPVWRQIYRVWRKLRCSKLDINDTKHMWICLMETSADNCVLRIWAYFILMVYRFHYNRDEVFHSGIGPILSNFADNYMTYCQADRHNAPNWIRKWIWTAHTNYWWFPDATPSYMPGPPFTNMV